MKRQLIIDSFFGYERTALLEDNELKEVIIEYKNNFNIGDIFVAKIKRILPNKFAFVDLGADRNAFLGIIDKKEKGLYIYDENKKKNVLNIKEGQDIVVQVNKEGTDLKGVTVTTNITITGKYVVLLLNEESIGISKKIETNEKRDFLKNIAKNVLPKGYGVIFRTNCNKVEKEIVENEILFLIEKGKKIYEKSKYTKSPAKIYYANTQAEKIVIDLLEESDEIIVNNTEAFQKFKSIFNNTSLYEENIPIFEAYSIETKIEKALHNKIWLKNGGFLIIDYIEAMTVIDVNTGKNIQKRYNDMIFKTNMEAIYQIAKEVRLRNISGIIMIDLIDMKDNFQKEEIFNTMKNLCKKDRLPMNIYPINELGIMYITRKKELKSLYEMVTAICPMCLGLGRIKNENYISDIIKSKIISIFKNTIYNKVIISSNSKVINSLNKQMNFIEFEKKYNKIVETKIIQTCRFDYFEIEKIIF